LLTNNPDKIEAFERSSILVTDRVPLIVEPQENNAEYLRTKQREMGHLFNI